MRLDKSPRRRPRVAWPTHLAAPYRIPVWRALESRLDVEILVVEKRLGALGAENRGADWDIDRVAGLRVTGLNTLRPSFHGVPMHLLLPTPRARRMWSTDVVLLGGWESPVYWQILLLAKLLRRPVVGFYESTLATNHFTSGPVDIIRRILFRAMDLVVVPGAAAREAVEAMGVAPSRIHQGFNAVDVRRIANAVTAVRAGSEDVAAGGRFVYIGQLIPRKRVVQMVEAFGRVSGDIDSLQIVGTGVDESAMRAVAERAEVQSRVQFLGHIENSDVPVVLAGARVLLLLSEEEVWGLVVNEALAAGLHVVITRSCGVTASVQEMPGVHVVCDDLSDLDEVLSSARNVELIANPPILNNGPEVFADVFAEAILQALGRSRS